MSLSIKLSKFLSQAGVASRRASERLILAGEIFVNGECETNVGRRVVPGEDEVVFEDEVLYFHAKEYILLHKPKGYTCTLSDVHAERLAIDLLERNNATHLYSVGRLDKDSEGLILFTNDGELCKRLTHPKYKIQKVYHVDLIGNVTEEDLKQLTSGVTEDGDLLTAESYRILSQKEMFARVEITLTEGKKREIRRMARVLGYHVKRLRRVSFGPIKLGKFNAGHYRALTEDDINRLKKVTGLK